MSVRSHKKETPVHPLRLQIEEARQVQKEQSKSASITSTTSEVLYTPEFDTLTHDESQVASLGVSPDAWRPISMLNTAHYCNLLESNSISASLAAKLESYKAVAGAQEQQ